jgi:hypothetical protein
MPGTTVTLALEGAVPLGQFADAIAGFRQLIEALSKEVAGDAEIQWTVEELQAGSAIATARGESDAEEVVEHVAHAYLDVGRAEELGRPLPYSARVKSATGAITRVLNGKIDAVRFETAEGDATVYSRTAAAPKSPVLSAYGAVTGRIQTLSNRGSLRFTLFDTVHDRAVSCYLQPGHDETMRGVWGRVATVAGWVTRDRATGRPISVRRVTRVEPRQEVEPGSFRVARGAVHVPSDTEPPEVIIRRLRDA